AAVTVALLAALGVPRDELAMRAHRVETERLGLQSGVQDQVAAAEGGASLLEVDYPLVRRTALTVPRLDLVTAFLGTHRSAAVHGWKVNGAGGEGGTVTIVCGDRHPDLSADVLPLRFSPEGVIVRSGDGRGRPSPSR